MDPNTRTAELERVIAAQHDALRAKDATIADLTAKLQAIEVRIAAMQQRLFGRSSERFHDPGQQSLDFLAGGTASPFVAAAAITEVPAAPSNETAAEPEPETAPASPRKRGKRLGRLPDHVETVDRVIDVPEADRIGHDGQPLAHLTNEITERLDYVPSHFRRLRIIRPVYGKPFADEETQPRVVAPAPTFLVAKGLPSDALVIQALIAKYADHLRSTDRRPSPRARALICRARRCVVGSVPWLNG